MFMIPIYSSGPRILKQRRKIDTQEHDNQSFYKWSKHRKIETWEHDSQSSHKETSEDWNMGRMQPILLQIPTLRAFRHMPGFPLNPIKNY
jgi:hypothetical protein